jgi:hypothetical protein
MFHSYVSLPEGTVSSKDSPEFLQRLGSTTAGPAWSANGAMSLSFVAPVAPVAVAPAATARRAATAATAAPSADGARGAQSAMVLGAMCGLGAYASGDVGRMGGWEDGF